MGAPAENRRSGFRFRKRRLPGDHRGRRAVRAPRPPPRLPHAERAGLGTTLDSGLREGGIAVPEPVATRDGSHYATATLPGGQEQRHIGLYHWVDGIPLREHLGESPKVSVVERWYSEIGRIAATIHTVTEGWEPPDEFRRHSFDADGMAGETPFWGRYWDHPALSDGARNELANIRKHVHLRLNELSKARGGYGMIHADLHAGNVLVAADGLHVIDFDDAGFGWHQYELAVALFGQEDEPHFETARTALFDGYRRQRPVDDDFFEPVPLFLLVRGLALIGWLMERPEHDGTERLDHLVKGARTQARSLFPNLTR